MFRIAAVSFFVLAACGTQTPASTATLEGNVQGASALTVDVPGTAATTRTDATGHFALLGVPAGASAVHFSGSGVDATLHIAELARREHRSISVSVSGHDATEHTEQSESDLRGPIASLAAPSFVVAGKTVTTTSATVFTKGGAAITFADLAVGDQIEAEGALQADGSLLARKVSVEAPESEPAESEAEFQGTLSAIDGATLTVGSITVHTSAATRIDDGPLAAGQQVEVQGALQADGSVNATEIKVLSAQEAAQLDVSGAVASVGTSSFVIGSTTIAVDSHTQFSGKGSFGSLADMKVGDLLDVECAKQADGSLLAIKVERVED